MSTICLAINRLKPVAPACINHFWLIFFSFSPIFFLQFYITSYNLFHTIKRFYKIFLLMKSVAKSQFFFFIFFLSKFLLVDWLLANRIANIYCHRHWLFCPQLIKRTVARKVLYLYSKYFYYCEVFLLRFFRCLISQTFWSVWLIISRNSLRLHINFDGLLCVILYVYYTYIYISLFFICSIFWFFFPRWKRSRDLRD